MGKPIEKKWSIGELEVPVKIYHERRGNSRVSIGKDAVLLRMPFVYVGLLQEKQELWAKEWLVKQLIKKPGLLNPLVRKVDYVQGQQIKLFDKTYTLEVVRTNQESASGKLIRHDVVQLKIPHDFPMSRITLLLSRIFAKHYRKYFVDKVDHWNNLHFRQRVRELRLKYNHSNWGSCSSSGNINLSTRLLFTPEPIQDYVIVHELAHLIELNHSSRFWKIVADVMPDYKKRERWLDENGSKCRF